MQRTQSDSSLPLYDLLFKHLQAAKEHDLSGFYNKKNKAQYKNCIMNERRLLPLLNAFIEACKMTDLDTRLLEEAKTNLQAIYNGALDDQFVDLRGYVSKSDDLDDSQCTNLATHLQVQVIDKIWDFHYHEILGGPSKVKVANHEKPKNKQKRTTATTTKYETSSLMIQDDSYIQMDELSEEDEKKNTSIGNFESLPQDTMNELSSYVPYHRYDRDSQKCGGLFQLRQASTTLNELVENTPAGQIARAATNMQPTLSRWIASNYEYGNSRIIEIDEQYGPAQPIFMGGAFGSLFSSLTGVIAPLLSGHYPIIHSNLPVFAFLIPTLGGMVGSPITNLVFACSSEARSSTGFKEFFTLETLGSVYSIVGGGVGSSIAVMSVGTNLMENVWGCAVGVGGAMTGSLLGITTSLTVHHLVKRFSLFSERVAQERENLRLQLSAPVPFIKKDLKI